MYVFSSYYQGRNRTIYRFGRIFMDKKSKRVIGTIFFKRERGTSVVNYKGIAINAHSTSAKLTLTFTSSLNSFIHWKFELITPNSRNTQNDHLPIFVYLLLVHSDSHRTPAVHFVANSMPKSIMSKCYYASSAFEI